MAKLCCRVISPRISLYSAVTETYWSHCPIVWSSSRACFSDLQKTYVVLWLVLDYVSDCIYIGDVVIRLRTGKQQQPPGLRLLCFGALKVEVNCKGGT